ncbi:MAG TPA: carboxypeptidase-like regulatory domain-containing protein [Candidatus Angelobacter sp.]|nr:carboxypeptidase-like regulatory domain-containing protein [Candidatus Angelobacter sp.]
MKHIRRVLAGIFIACLFSLPVFAALTGDISGTVTDPNGAVIAGAKITVKNVSTGAVRTVTSSDVGQFSVPQLELGTYDITVEKTGFKSSTSRAVVRSGENTRLNSQLEIGAAGEVVTVEAATPTLDVATAQVSSSLDSSQVVTLPNQARDPVAYATLSPGVIPVNADNSNFLGTGSFNSNGSRGRANNITVDNIISSDLSTTGESGTGTFVIDGVQEFKLITNNFDAEFGRNSGSQVQVLTKSGTNQIHGTAYIYHQNVFFNARDFFAAPHGVTPFVQNQGGFAAGGPIYKDHTFIYGHWELDKTRGGGGTATARVLTPAQVAGITDPTSAALFSQYGSPSSASGLISSAAPNQDNGHSWSVRIDQLLRNGQDTIFARYGENPDAQVSPSLTFVQTNIPGFGASVSSNARTFSGGYTMSIKANLINQFRVGFGRSNPNFTANTPFPLGPFINIAGKSGFGLSQIIPQGRTQNTFQYGDTVSWVKGRHTWKFGGDILRYQAPSVFDSQVRGVLTFASVAAFQAGTPAVWTQNVGDSHRHNFSLDHFWFVQDDFRLKDTLTLNLGFRLESSGGVSEGNNLLSNLDPNNHTPIGLFGTGALGGVDIGGTAFHRNWNPAPRLGFAWNPDRGKLVVRGGYGIAYDYIFLNPITNLRFSAPFLPSLTVQQFTGGNTYAALVAGTAPAQVAIRTAAASGQFLATQANFGNLSPVDQNLDNPRNQQADLGVEYQVMKDLVLKTTLINTRNDHLQVSVPLNLVAPGNRPAPATSAADQAARLAQFQAAFAAETGNAAGTIINSRLDPRFNSVTQVQSIGTSNFNSLQFEAIKKFGQGLSFDANYTWGHSIDDISDALGVLTNDVPSAIDPTKPLSANRGNSAFDIRQRFVLSYVYELPFAKHFGGVTKRILDGWSLGGIFSTQTGEPITILAGPVSGITDNLLTGNSRVVADGDATQIIPSAFNTMANLPVSQPLLGNDGTSGRNHLRLAGITNFDTSLTKAVKVTEGKSLLLRWEVFNALNHPNLSGFQNILTSDPVGAGFGTYQSTATNMRQMQVSAKFQF